jgi:hypothetical protein
MDIKVKRDSPNYINLEKAFLQFELSMFDMTKEIF